MTSKVEAIRPESGRVTPDIHSMSDAELATFVAQGQAELAARERRHKEDTIAKIRALASAAGLAVAIEGAPGRPGGKSKKRMDAEKATTAP